MKLLKICAKRNITLFKLSIKKELRYKSALLVGSLTQFTWAILSIMGYYGIYKLNSNEFPMNFQSLINYMWMQQALMYLFSLWNWDNDLLSSIKTGDIVYLLTKPIDLYNYWFSHIFLSRIAKSIFRAIPIITLSCLLPNFFQFKIISDGSVFLFLFSILLALIIVVSMEIMIYSVVLYIVDDRAIRIIFSSICQLLNGSIIPLQFFPKTMYSVIAWLPFSLTQDVSFRILNGDFTKIEMFEHLGYQLIMCISLIILGKLLLKKILLKIELQGG